MRGQKFTGFNLRKKKFSICDFAIHAKTKTIFTFAKSPKFNLAKINPIKVYNENFIQESISKYRSHPSIVKIKESTTTEHFLFRNTTEEEVKRVINNLGSGKAHRCSDIFVPFLTASINNTLNSANYNLVIERGSVLRSLCCH